MTWGGLPSSVPVGYIGYFCLPAVIGAALGRRLERTVRMAQADHAPDRRPRRRLLLGLGLQRGSRRPARRLLLRLRDPGLGLFEGTLHQYPIYDAIAMGIQMMVFTYLLGRTDSQGRNVIEMWADKMSKTRVQSAVRVRRRRHRHRKRALRRGFRAPSRDEAWGYVTSGPTAQLFPGRTEPTQMTNCACSFAREEVDYDNACRARTPVGGWAKLPVKT